MEITEFIAARLDEDEAAAAAASDSPWTPWRGRPGLGLVHLEYGVALPGQTSGSLVSIATATWMDAEHIARHDPARVLREVAAKRAIVAAHQPFADPHAPPGGPWCGTCGDAEQYSGHGHPCDTIRLLAAVWSDHPDYKQEWVP